MILPSYGLLTPEDAALIARGLEAAFARFPNPVVVEIGIWDGGTARGIRGFASDRPFRYYAVDNSQDVPAAVPFEGAQLVRGDSGEVYDQVPLECHFVLLDGCHCVNHVILDFLHYGARVVGGGLLAMHDVAPGMQGRDYQKHGPRIPDFHVATTRGLELLASILELEWVEIGRETASDWGGTILFQKRS